MYDESTVVCFALLHTADRLERKEAPAVESGAYACKEIQYRSNVVSSAG